MKSAGFCLCVWFLGAAVYAGESREEVFHIIDIQHTEIWSEGRLDLIPEIYSPDFIGHFPGGTVHGHQGIRQRVESHRQSFPNWKEAIVDVIIENNKVVTRFISSGTNLGPFLGKPPTGKAVEISEVSIFLLRDGKIAEQWVYPDMRAMQQQLSGGQR